MGEVADSMERHDALTAHTRFRHGVEQGTVVSPLSAALASLLSFTLGGIIPLLAILASPPVLRLPATLVAVVVALAPSGGPTPNILRTCAVPTPITCSGHQVEPGLGRQGELVPMWIKPHLVQRSDIYDCGGTER